MLQRLLSDSSLLFFTTASIVYGLLGAPTADHPGWVEFIILSLIILSLGVSPFISVLQFDRNRNQENWIWAGQFLFLFGLVMPIIVALFHDNDVINIVRDLIGFIFLLVPLFITSFFKNQERLNIFISMCLLIGVCFSIRTLYPDTFLNIRGSELLYLANSPLVLFASIFFIGFGAKKLFDHITLKNFFIFLGAFVLSIICLIAMMQDIRRASFVAVIVSLIIFTAHGFIKNPVRTTISVLFIAAFLFLFQQDIFNIINQITLKTSQVGLNMRMQEWQAVWSIVTVDWLALLFGQGWGASFESPAVGNLPVTFTHSLLSAVLLKSGIIGLLLCSIYLFFIFEKLARVVFSNPIAGIALFWPFFIAVLFYASYKSLDFGLLLTLIIIWHKKEKPNTINE